MKTADEIKKGLKHCLTHTGCANCPYDDVATKDADVCMPELLCDSLRIIQQLEAERDAAVKDIRTSCKLCKHFQPKTCTCKSKKPCACIHGVNTEWQWRGVQKEG